MQACRLGVVSQYTLYVSTHPLPSSEVTILCQYRGVLNVVHGTRDVVNNMLDHPDIKAVSFVGSNAAGRYISERASANGKRVQVSLLFFLL